VHEREGWAGAGRRPQPRHPWHEHCPDPTRHIQVCSHTWHLVGGIEVAEENVARKKLGEYLLEAGLINETQLKEALRRQRQLREPLGQILARTGIVSEADICRVLHQQLGLPIVDLQSIAIDEHAIGAIREELAKKYTAIPIEIENRSTIRVAMADPLNASALEDIRFQSGYFVRPVLAPPSEIVDAISKYYHIDASRALRS
jgi:Type II secretion system (T2SS), protein E, N-terminal domain